MLARFVIILGTILCLFSSCSKIEEIEPRSATSFDFFDTFTTLTSYRDEKEEEFEENKVLVFSTLSYYHKLTDIYHEYEGMNNLCTVNLMAGKERVEVSKDLIDFVLYALEISEKCDNKVNIMMGSITKVWKDSRVLPTIEGLEEKNKHTSPSLLVIDTINNTLYITDKDASIDVGAFSKGYAVEKCAELLENKGINSYSINSGGNIRVIGTKPNGKGWKTGIKDPEGSSTIKLSLELKNASCVTSGGYERFIELDGKKYSHIIDPETLYPTERYLSVTIISPHSSDADSLSTALSNTTREEGEKIIKGFPSTGVIWIEKDGTIRYSEIIKEYLI